MRQRTFRFAVFTLLCLVGTTLAAVRAQGCVIPLGDSIVDNAITTIEVQVTGALNNDLSTQELCGVRINFKHDYLGDLTIDLESPGGQTVRLVGPQTDAIASTNLTTWDVLFVRCDIGSPAPEPAYLSDRWSNNQSWPALGEVGGSYFPSSGCLDEFNTGPVNGTWRLIVNDNDAGFDGIVNSIQLIFCNAPPSLGCEECITEAGAFSIDTLIICANEQLEPSLFEPTFSAPGTVPDSLQKAYEYAISFNGGSFELESVDRGSWAAGSYTICGLTYGAPDRDSMVNWLRASMPGDIRQMFRDNNVGFCAALTESCIELTVLPVEPPTVIDTIICFGEQVTVRGRMFNRTGSYVIEGDTMTPCVGPTYLDLTVLNFTVRIAQQDTLRCSDPLTTLDASQSDPGLSGNYSWTTAGGSILGAVNQPVIQISAPGEYTLVLTDSAGCSKSKSIEVETDGTHPFISVKGGTIDCATGFHQMSAQVFPVNGDIQWSGPNGFSSSELTPNVSTGGTYKLTVTDLTGCSASKEVGIDYDTTSIPVEAVILRKNCGSAQTFLRLDRLAIDPDGTNSYSWEGPQAFSDDRRNTVVTNAGTYVGTYRSGNGCVSRDTVQVTADYQLPAFRLQQSSDSIACGQQVLLDLLDVEADVLIRWTGPGVDVDSTASLVVETHGTFVAELTADNGCIATATYEIYEGSDLRSVDQLLDTISCTKDTVVIGVTSVVADAYEWSGPGLLDDHSPFVRVTEPGAYNVRLDFNGCEQIVVLNVFGDLDPIRTRLVWDTITCDNPLADMTFETPVEPPVDIGWYYGDSLFARDSIVQLATNRLVTLRIAGQNGCVREVNFRPLVNSTAPEVFAPDISFGCVDSTQIFAFLLDSVKTLVWSGPFGFSSSVRAPYIQRPGIYNLETAGANGCVSNHEVDVVADVVEPIIDLTSDPWTCLDSFATLMATSPDSSLQYSWFFEGRLVSDSSVAVARQVGEFTLVARALNSCETIKQVSVAEAIPAPIYAPPANFNCRDSVVILRASSDSTDVTYEWFDIQGLSLSRDSLITVTTPGTYQLVATTSDDCVSRDTLSVEVDTVPPLAVATAFGEVRCENRAIVLSAAGSIGNGLSYSWISPGGTIWEPEEPEIPTEGVGMYLLQVTDSLNHCTASDSIEILQQESSLSELDLTIISECQGNANGAIVINEVAGATSPLTYELSNMITSDTPRFDGLGLGTYLVRAIDTFGCKIDTVIQLDGTQNGISVNLGDDIEVLLGDSARLQAVLNIDSGLVDRILWSPEVRCENCLETTTLPTESQDYTLTLVDIFGCEVTDQLRVFVEERAQFYVPNVFSPNGDGVNDILSVFAHPGIRNVRSFIIYDRWGNQVYGMENFVPGQGDIGWDGSFDGNMVTPGVFTYHLMIETINNYSEQHTGDVTLIR